MTKYLLLLLPLLGFATAIKMEHAELKPLGKIIKTNAQITQLSNQKQTIVSRLSGHLEAYYIEPGEYVKDGDKVVLIESIAFSKMTAEYIALVQQLKAVQEQKNTAMTLHKKGLASQNDVSSAIIALEEIRSKQSALASQLKSMNINPVNLKEPTDQFVLYAHADGVVGKILAPLHSNVNAQTPLVTLVNQSGYYAVAYLGVDDVMKVSDTTKGWVNIANRQYPSSFVQLLPNIDQETQRAKVLFQIEKSPANLLLGAYTQMVISLAPTQNVIMVKKSALTLFKGEWVVFVEKEHEDEPHNEEEAEHEEHDHDAHEEGESHETHADDEHEEEEDEHKHDEHEEDAPYEAKVVEIIAYTGEYIAIKGLAQHEEYVSEGVYFVKSMLLKSSLGGHGH